MKSRDIPVIFLYAVCIQLSVLATTDSNRFESYPSIVTLPVGARIKFEVTQSPEVEIAVLDAQD